MTGDVLTSHQKCLFFVATNSAGDVLTCRQKISVFVNKNTAGDVLTSHQKYIFVGPNVREMS